jgi:hypothetical protein
MSAGIDHAISFFALRTFNFLYDTVDSTWSTVKQTTADFFSYMGGRHNIWHFLDNGIGPLPDSVISSRSVRQPIWSYRTDTNCLHHRDSGGWYDLFWLSASILVGGREYSMDDMIRNFSYIAPGDTKPTCRTIMYVWSIGSGIWFAPGDRPIMRIIDGQGEVHEIEVYSDRDSERWTRVFSNEEETDSGGEADQSGGDSDSGSDSGSDSDSDSDNDSDSGSGSDDSATAADENIVGDGAAAGMDLSSDSSEEDDSSETGDGNTAAPGITTAATATATATPDDLYVVQPPTDILPESDADIGSSAVTTTVTTKE